MQRQVGGRETQLAAEPLAELHAAADPVGPAEQPRRDREIAGSSAARTSELLTRSPSISKGGTSSTVKPSRFPRRAGSRSCLAAPRIVEVVTDDDVPHAEPRGEQVLLEAARADCRKLRVEMQHTTRSTPYRASASSFSRSRVSRAGASAPSKYSRGVGSKVTTVAGSPSSSARRRSAASMCW